MNRTILLLVGLPLLLVGFLAAPVLCPLGAVVPDLALRLALWVTSSAGVLCLWLALSPPDQPPARRRAAFRAVPQGQPRAA